jgi:uncharacterized membrane protein YjgN (DUF898 family)
MLFLSFIKGVVDGSISNLIRNSVTLGTAKFKGEIDSIKLGFISLTNILILIFSLGLLYPYAKIRYLKEKIENTYFACENFDKFVSNNINKDSGVLGEETVDFFDIDIGI